MNTLQTIHHIAANTHRFDNVVIYGEDDRTPMEAIERISTEPHDKEWRYNSELEKGTLLIY